MAWQAIRIDKHTRPGIRLEDEFLGEFRTEEQAHEAVTLDIKRIKESGGRLSKVDWTIRPTTGKDKWGRTLHISGHWYFR
jgi:hypothetical protein